MKMAKLKEFGFSFVCEMPCSAQTHEIGLVRRELSGGAGEIRLEVTASRRVWHVLLTCYELLLRPPTLQ
jgi:hypothetical protein